MNTQTDRTRVSDNPPTAIVAVGGAAADPSSAVTDLLARALMRTTEAIPAHLREPAHPADQGGPAGAENLLAGVLRCGRCGAAMDVDYPQEGGLFGRLRRYCCPTGSPREGCAAVPSHQAEQFVAALMEAVCHTKGVAIAVADHIDRRLTDERTRLREEQLDCRRAMGPLGDEQREVERREAAGLDRPTERSESLEYRFDERMQTVLHNGGLLESLAACTLTDEAVEKKLGQFWNLWWALRPPERRELVGLLVERAEWHGEAAGMTVRFRPAYWLATTR